MTHEERIKDFLTFKTLFERHDGGFHSGQTVALVYQAHVTRELFDRQHAFLIEQEKRIAERDVRMEQRAAERDAGREAREVERHAKEIAWLDRSAVKATKGPIPLHGNRPE